MLELQPDVQVSTLAWLVSALGGQLEMIAHLSGGTIWITRGENVYLQELYM